MDFLSFFKKFAIPRTIIIWAGITILKLLLEAGVIKVKEATTGETSSQPSKNRGSFWDLAATKRNPMTRKIASGR